MPTRRSSGRSAAEARAGEALSMSTVVNALRTAAGAAFLPLIQSPSGPQRLHKYTLDQASHPGEFTPSCAPRP